MMTFPEWLAWTMAIKDLSIEQAANMADISTRQLRRWLSGDSEPKLRPLWLLCMSAHNCAEGENEFIRATKLIVGEACGHIFIQKLFQGHQSSSTDPE